MTEAAWAKLLENVPTLVSVVVTILVGLVTLGKMLFRKLGAIDAKMDSHGLRLQDVEVVLLDTRLAHLRETTDHSLRLMVGRASDRGSNGSGEAQ